MIDAAHRINQMRIANFYLNLMQTSHYNNTYYVNVFVMFNKSVFVNHILNLAKGKIIFSQFFYYIDNLTSLARIYLTNYK